MKLLLPEVTYKQTFLSALREYEREEGENETSKHFLLTNQRAYHMPFDEFITRLHLQSDGKYLPPNYIPQTTYWLIDNEQYIGAVAIRHELNDFLYRIGGHIGYNIRPAMRKKGYGTKMLELALVKAKALGITNVLITCDETNEASRKVIEANGGVYENRLPQGDGRPLKLRYWIAVG